MQLDASTLCTEDASLPKVINDVKIIAIDMLNILDGCLQCGHNTIPTEDEECVECKKCGILQCREECKTNVSAHFTVKKIDGEKLKFYVYNDIVAKIADRAPQEVTKLTMLKSRLFSLQHSKSIIQSVTRI